MGQRESAIYLFTAGLIPPGSLRDALTAEAYKKQFGKFEEEEKLREAKKKGAFFR